MPVERACSGDDRGPRRERQAGLVRARASRPRGSSSTSSTTSTACSSSIAPTMSRAARRSRSSGRSPFSALADVARIAVAATAPFGADVLERLAAKHEISALLTRPDAPAGRGRKLVAPPAKLTAERLGIPVLQPERLEPGLDPGAPTVVVVAYGRIVPDELLAERLLAERAPVAPPALARRGAGRAHAHGRRRRDGRDDPPDREGAGRGADRGAGRVPRRGGRRRGRRLREGGGARRRPARRRARQPGARVPPAAGGGRDLRRQDRARRPDPRSRAARARARRHRPRPVAAHRRARRAARAAGHGLARAGRRGREVRAVEVQPAGGRRMEYEAWLRGLR